MKVDAWLSKTVKQLEQAGIVTARLDCLVLLEDITGKTRAHLLAHPERILSRSQVAILDEKVEQRVKHVPLAYIRGKTEFYGRKFVINSSVLEPRPESEAIIDILLELVTPTQIIDVGTGSGALAITAKLELPGADVIGVDIDPTCLKTAQINGSSHKAKITYIEGDLLASLHKTDLAQAVILANLPYVPTAHKLNKSAMHEPKLAIFGGNDGLDLYRRLFSQTAEMRAVKPRHIIAESLPFQHEELAKIARAAGYRLDDGRDFVQLFTAQEPLPVSP